LKAGHCNGSFASNIGQSSLLILVRYSCNAYHPAISELLPTLLDGLARVK
jgi:hypothetical protein